MIPHCSPSELVHRRRTRTVGHTARLFAGLRSGLAALLLTTCGCLHVKQELIIHRNGSARLLLHYSMPEDSVPLARQLVQAADSANAGDKEPAWWLNQQACREHLEDTGLKLERHRTYNADNRTHTILECRAENLHDALGNGPLKNLSLSETPDGNLKLNVDNPELESLRLNGPIPENLRIEFIITTPTPITSTNGIQTEDRTTTWLVTRETLIDNGVADFSVQFKPRGETSSPAEKPEQ